MQQSVMYEYCTCFVLQTSMDRRLRKFGNSNVIISLIGINFHTRKTLMKRNKNKSVFSFLRQL